MDLFEAYRAQYGALANEIDLMQRRELPVDWDKNLPVFPADPKGVADGTRRARYSTCSLRTSPGSSAGRRISHRRTGPP